MLDKATLEALLAQDSSIGAYLDPDEIGEACDDAAGETGWPFPVSGTQQELWTKKRARRNCFEKLWTQSARKFKVDQLSLNQRFDHYGAVIDKMDAAFEKFKTENPRLFQTMDMYKSFGTVVGTGLVYDIIGNDITER